MSAHSESNSTSSLGLHRGHESNSPANVQYYWISIEAVPQNGDLEKHHELVSVAKPCIKRTDPWARYFQQQQGTPDRHKANQRHSNGCK